jgi:hypothetical protein
MALAPEEDRDAAQEAHARGDRHQEAQVVIEGWRRYYDAVRPHASLGYCTDAFR